MAQCFQLFGSVDIALIAPKLFLNEVRDMEVVSRLEGEVFENDTGHVLMENSQDSTPPEDHQLLSSRQLTSVTTITITILLGNTLRRKILCTLNHRTIQI